MFDELSYINAVRNNLKNLREEYGLSQEEFAKLFDMNTSDISRIESTKESGAKNISIGLMFRIANKFNLNISDLLPPSVQWYSDPEASFIQNEKSLLLNCWKTKTDFFTKLFSNNRCYSEQILIKLIENEISKNIIPPVVGITGIDDDESLKFIYEITDIDIHLLQFYKNRICYYVPSNLIDSIGNVFELKKDYEFVFPKIDNNIGYLLNNLQPKSYIGGNEFTSEPIIIKTTGTLYGSIIKYIPKEIVQRDKNKNVSDLDHLIYISKCPNPLFSEKDYLCYSDLIGQKSDVLLTKTLYFTHSNLLADSENEINQCIKNIRDKYTNNEEYLGPNTELIDIVFDNTVETSIGDITSILEEKILTIRDKKLSNAYKSVTKGNRFFYNLIQKLLEMNKLLLEVQNKQSSNILIGKLQERTDYIYKIVSTNIDSFYIQAIDRFSKQFDLIIDDIVFDKLTYVDEDKGILKLDDISIDLLANEIARYLGREIESILELVLGKKYKENFAIFFKSYFENLNNDTSTEDFISQYLGFIMSGIYFNYSTEVNSSYIYACIQEVKLAQKPRVSTIKKALKKGNLEKKICENTFWSIIKGTNFYDKFQFYMEYLKYYLLNQVKSFDSEKVLDLLHKYPGTLIDAYNEKNISTSTTLTFIGLVFDSSQIKKYPLFLFLDSFLLDKDVIFYNISKYQYKLQQEIYTMTGDESSLHEGVVNTQKYVESNSRIMWVLPQPYYIEEYINMIKNADKVPISVKKLISATKVFDESNSDAIDTLSNNCFITFRNNIEIFQRQIELYKPDYIILADDYPKTLLSCLTCDIFPVSKLINKSLAQRILRFPHPAAPGYSLETYIQKCIQIRDGKES